jgi:hypothetical protein
VNGVTAFESEARPDTPMSSFTTLTPADLYCSHD